MILITEGNIVFVQLEQCIIAFCKYARVRVGDGRSVNYDITISSTLLIILYAMQGVHGFTGGDVSAFV